MLTWDEYKDNLPQFIAYTGALYKEYCAALSQLIKDVKFCSNMTEVYGLIAVNLENIMAATAAQTATFHDSIIYGYLYTVFSSSGSYTVEDAIRIMVNLYFTCYERSDAHGFDITPNDNPAYTGASKY